MDQNFNKYKEFIKSFLNDDDIPKILKSPMADHFKTEDKMRIRNSHTKFFEEFEKLHDPKKYYDFIEVTKDINDWIAKLLTNSEEAIQYRNKFEAIFQLLHLQLEDAVSSIPMSEVFLRKCCHAGILTEMSRDKLIAKLEKKGETAAKYDFLWEVPMRSEHCYGKLIILLDECHTNYIPKFCDDLYKIIIEDGTCDRKKMIMDYADSVIEMNMVDFCSVQMGDSEQIESDCGSGKLVNHACGDIKTVKIESRVIESKNTNNIDDTPQSLPIVSPSSNGSPTGVYTKSNIDSSDDEDDDNNDTMNDEDNEETMNGLFGALKGQKSADLLNFAPSVKSRKEGTKKLEIRNYQQELAQDGIKGKNVLICAPTGSGKTIVAVKIVEEHLQNNAKGKVAFIVHRIALVEQQYAQFSNYLKYKITRLSGSAKSTCAPLIGHIPCFDIFVMTSDILRNALEQDNETKLKSLNIFTMILFDECHNCDKKHPYNRIMNHYFKSKERGESLPQIIGFTASTGTNKANTMEKAMKRLYTLCANLDCYVVSTVKDFAEELKKNQSVPEEEIIAAPPRDEDKFEQEIHTQIRSCEQMLLAMNSRDFFPKDPETQLIFSIPEDRMHQKYANFVGKLETLLNNTKSDKEGREAIYSISQYLNAFVRALMVNHLFRAQDATNLIREYLHIENSSVPTCQVEKLLRRNLRKLEHGELMQTNNPCLEVLKNKIIQQLERDEDSRIIVFVRERAYTQILKDVFTSLKDPKIKCDSIVGNTISAEKGGLTQNEMEEVLGRFKKGQCNVLFSTTVAEEGLDVQTCNLVIRYGHVTNETAMVQSRGRARAQQSKYLVIVPNKLQWQINKENINKYRETMMYRAIEKFQSMDVQERDKQIEECKFERQLLENTFKMSKVSLISEKSKEKTRIFYCKKCSTVVCSSSDIRVAEKAHHLVINTNVFTTLEVNQNTNEICCKKCTNHLGNRQGYKSRFFPNLTISAFKLIVEGDVIFRSYKKWRDIDFTVNDVSNKELLDFPNSHILCPGF